MANLNFLVAKTIKILCVHRDITITQLGQRLGMGKENIHARMKRDNFKLNDIVKMADVLGYNVELRFVDPLTEKTIEVEAAETPEKAARADKPPPPPAMPLQTNIDENIDNEKMLDIDKNLQKLLGKYF